MLKPEIQKDISIVRDFLNRSRGQSQREILKYFLQIVINTKHISGSGSILIDDPEKKRLILFNPDNFLEKEGYLKSGEPWQEGFEYGQGIAGKAYVLRQSIFVPDTAKSAEFSTVEGEVPIAAIICLPIITRDSSAPFGVVSFHVSELTPAFNESTQTLAEIFVTVLGFALASAREKLLLHRNVKRRIFLGCASEDLAIARKIQNSITSETALVRIWNQGVFKAGGYALDTLLRQVKEYDYALFLFTPNDTAQVRGRNYLIARDNVLFEAGLFFSQIGRGRTLLIVPRVPNLKLPSDLDGLINLTYFPEARPEDLHMALEIVCNQIIDIVAGPLPPIQ